MIHVEKGDRHQIFILFREIRLATRVPPMRVRRAPYQIGVPPFLEGEAAHLSLLNKIKAFWKTRKYIRIYCKSLKFLSIPKEILLFLKVKKLKDFKLIEL